MPDVNMKDALQTAAAGLAVGTMLDGGGGSTADTSAEQRAQEALTAEQIQANVDEVNRLFSGFDDNYYTGIADAYKNYQTPLYQEQVTEARRRLPASVPHTQSSAYNRKASQLETDILRNEGLLQSGALDEANRRRSEVDMSRNELLNLASSGADTESVRAQAAARQQQYLAPPSFSPIADLFGKYTSDAANMALLNKRAPAAQITRPLTFSHNPTSSQRIIA